jgi:integrase
MAIFKRGGVYWFGFTFAKKRFQRSSRQGNPRIARQIEAAFRTALAKGEVGLTEQKPAATLREFAEEFRATIEARCAAKPNTIVFYFGKLARLLDYVPLANARLDEIDEALIEKYVLHRTKAVAAGTVNRELATLRKLLRLASEWKTIDRVPRIRMLPGERIRDFVLSSNHEALYLSAAPQPLKDIAILLLETGLRHGEALALRWDQVRLQAIPGSHFGFLQILDGKSRNARRTIPLSDRASSMLRERLQQRKSEFVLANREGKKYLVTSINHLHQKVRRKLQLPQDFVLHSLRHTMLTRLGESGADVFTIMKIAGHSSVSVSQRYVHPSPESVERAFERLQKFAVTYGVAPPNQPAYTFA